MNRISFMIILSFFAAILIQKAFGIPTITASPDDDDDDWDEDDSSSEADDDSRIYKNPRNSPSTECPRDEEQATLLGQKCLRKCSSDEDCKSKKKKCLCDGVCGMSCIKPDRECPELSQPSLGTVILSGRLFGARATYTCPHGYHVVGLQSRLCQADGHWAGAEPACKENIYCLTPPVIEHARHSALPEQETFDLDSTVQYHCHTGYVTNGFPRAKCLAIEGHASWYGPDIQCEPRSCGQPSDPANGWHAGECYTFGCRITYHCGEGYELVGKQERYCQADGSWTPKELPTCVLVTSVQCPVPENPKNGKVIYTTFSYNSVVSYECRYGYTLVGESSRRCGADRKWSGSLPTCKEINCGIPGILYNGWLENIEAGTGLGASIIFRCHPEMLLQGHSSTVCQIDGRWRYPVPECLAPCIVPTISQGTVIPIEVEVDVNATTISTPPVVITSTGKVKHGTSLEVSCDEHYEFPVSSLAPPTCNNGTWTVIPRCIPARCKSMPKPPKNGMVIAPKTEHGMKARFKCKDGYNITGPGGKEITDPNIYVLTCSFGNWTGETPQCQEVYCSFPGHIPNGKVLLVGNMGLYDYRPYVKKIVNNKQIMYDCDKGYVLEEGPPGATCVGGKWRPTELPKCLLGQHPRLRFNRRRRSIQLKYLRSKFLLQEARKLNKWMTENGGIKLSDNDHSSTIIRKKRNIHNLPFIPHKISTYPTQQLTSYSKRFISRLFPKFKRLENANLKWNKRIPDNFHENSIEFQKPLNRIRDVFIKYYDKMKRRDKNYAMCLFKDCNLQNDIFSYQQNLQTSDYHKRMIQPFYEQRYGINDYPKLIKRHKPISKTNIPISPTSLIAKRLINENNQERNHINNPTISQNETMIKPTIDQIFYQLFIANRKYKNVSHPYINKNKTFPIISIVSDTIYRCDSRSKNSVNCHGNSTISAESTISKFKSSQMMRRSKRDALINSSNSTDNETASVNNNGTMTAIDREPSEDRKGRGPRGPCEELKDENFLNITIVRQGKSIGRNSPGTILHLVCNPGFKLNIKNPNATARCVRGIWKPQKPACLSAPCSVPSTEHGKYFEIVSESNSNLRLLMPYEEIGNDQIIAFECEQGYNIHGSNQLQCVHGSWSISNFPECVPLPCILPTIPNVIYEGGYRTGLTIAHGSSVSVHCDNPVNNLPLQMICNKGLMSPNTIHCETGGSRKSREEYLGEAEFSGGENFLNALMNNGHKITSVETKSNVTERGINVTHGRDCGSPIQVDGSLVYKNGEPVDPDDSYPSGTEISFNCIASIAGERNTWKIICEDGNWIGRSLSCANGTCLFKNNDPNVVSFYNDLEIREDVVEFPPGATIISRCVDIGKYAMVGSGERTCIHSEWSGQKPVCYGLNQENDYAMEKPPTILFRHQNGPIAQSNNGKLIVYPGTTVHMECLWMRRFGNPKWNVNHDYRNYPEGWVTEEGRDPQLEYRLSILHAVEDDSGIYTCQTPARHEHSVEVVVKAINCPDIPIRRGLIVSSNDTKLSSRILLSCANGNSLIGASELFCLPSGNWSAPLPVCESVECGDIPLPMNSTTPRVAVLSREVGGRAAFSCPSGYGLRGPSESICLPSGEWATPFPTCIEVQCDNPGAPQNGYAQGSSPYRAGDVVQFNCNPEYMMQGQPIIACQDNGRWSGGLPKCVQACSYPGTAISGRMSSVKFYYAIGESITFTCDAGLELRGAKMLKCLRNGKWSNAIPTCVNSTQANKTSEQVIG